MALATLSIDLEARLAGLQQGLDKAGRLAEKEAARMSKAFSAAGTALASIGAGVSVAAITQYFGAIVNGLDALNDLADATGASIENLSALEGVALRTGTSLDTVGSSLVKFNAVLKDAKPGSDAAAALQALGLNAEELKRIDPAEALRQTAVALAGFADDGNKARIVQELFGKSVKDAAPFLKDLAEQGALVGKVTKEQAEEAEKFNKQLFALQAAAVDASRAIAGPLITSMNNLIDKMREAQKEGRLASAAAEEFSKRILKLAPPQLQALALGAQILTRGPVGAEPGAPQPPGFRPSQNYGDAFRPSLPGSLNAPAAGSRTGGRGGSAKPEFGAAITDSAQLTRNLFLQSEKDYEEIDKQLARVEERAREAAATLRKSLADEGRAVFEATRTPAESLAAEIDRLNALLQAGAIDWDTYARAQFAAQDGYDKAIEGTKKQAEETKGIAADLGLSFSSAFEDAIVGGNSLRDVLKGLEQDILRIVTRKLVTEPLGDAVAGAAKGFDFSKLLAFLPSFDVGSDYVPRDMVAKIHKGERILTAAENRAGGGLVVNVNMSGAQVSSRATAQQQAEMIGRQVRLAVSRNG